MAIAHPKYKVAAVQAAPAFLDLDASVEKADRATSTRPAPPAPV